MLSKFWNILLETSGYIVFAFTKHKPFDQYCGNVGWLWLDILYDLLELHTSEKWQVHLVYMAGNQEHFPWISAGPQNVQLAGWGSNMACLQRKVCRISRLRLKSLILTPCDRSNTKQMWDCQPLYLFIEMSLCYSFF